MTCGFVVSSSPVFDFPKSVRPNRIENLQPSRGGLTSCGIRNLAEWCPERIFLKLGGHQICEQFMRSSHKTSSSNLRKASHLGETLGLGPSPKCHLNRPYRGLNVSMLASQGYGSPYWLTFNQANPSLPNAHIRNGTSHDPFAA